MERAYRAVCHTHISAGRRGVPDPGELWRYRDLIVLFTRRSFQLTYKQTILGPAWIVLSPLLTSAVYALVFGGVAGVDTEGVPKLLFYLCGNGVWTFFAACVTKNARTFTDNASLFGKVYFPRLTVPISNVLSAGIQFCVQMLLVGLLLIYFVATGQVHPHWAAWPLIPLALLHLGLLGLGFGVLISSLTTRYRDLAVLVTFGVQLWMFATPVVYPLSLLGDGGLRQALLLNPVIMPIEMVRYAVLGQGTVLPGCALLSWGITGAVMVLSILLFHRVEKTFMDTV